MVLDKDNPLMGTLLLSLSFNNYSVFKAQKLPKAGLQHCKRTTFMLYCGPIEIMSQSGTTLQSVTYCGRGMGHTQAQYNQP